MVRSFLFFDLDKRSSCRTRGRANGCLGASFRNYARVGAHMRLIPQRAHSQEIVVSSVVRVILEIWSLHLFGDDRLTTSPTPSPRLPGPMVHEEAPVSTRSESLLRKTLFSKLVQFREIRTLINELPITGLIYIRIIVTSFSLFREVALDRFQISPKLFCGLWFLY